ncbi:unnamed protein product [Prunus armeniaca]
MPRSDVHATDETQALPPISPVPPPTSGLYLRSKEKGKAPLEEHDEEDSDDDEDEMPLQRKQRALDFDSAPGDVGSKRARVESFPDTEEASLVGLEDVPQRLGKEKVSGLFVVKESKMVTLKVRTIKLEEGVDLPPYEPYSGRDVAAEGILSRRGPIFQSSSMPRTHGPRFERVVNLTSAMGKRIVMEQKQPDVVLANAVNNLSSLWNTIRAPNFDPVVDPDTLSGMMP